MKIAGESTGNGVNRDAGINWIYTKIPRPGQGRTSQKCLGVARCGGKEVGSKMTCLAKGAGENDRENRLFTTELFTTNRAGISAFLPQSSSGSMGRRDGDRGGIPSSGR